MIEIIKHGKRKYHFICHECGCEFTSNGDEIYNENISFNARRVINCPECGAVIDASEKDPSANKERDESDSSILVKGSCCASCKKCESDMLKGFGVPCQDCPWNPYKMKTTLTNIDTSHWTYTDYIDNDVFHVSYSDMSDDGWLTGTVKIRPYKDNRSKKLDTSIKNIK